MNINAIDEEHPQRRQSATNLNPLPFVTPPPAQRPSLTDQLMRSTYLFPKTLSNPRMVDNNNIDDDNSSVVIDHDDDDERVPTNDNKVTLKNENYIIHNNPRIQPIFSSKNEFQLPPRPSTIPAIKKKMKSVHFHDKLTTALYSLINIPLASEMTNRKKHKIWYSANEYDQFKYQAAKQAGVKIVRYDSDKVGQHAQFVMMGDFDGSTDNRASTSTVVCATKPSKCHYNENEYNDRTSSTNHSHEVVCKRGLGYHFSRSRKKSQKVTRSAVIAWQKTLRDQSSSPSLSSSSNNNNGSNSKIQQHDNSSASSTVEKKKNHLEKSRMMLALVSAKCSRVAREEAKWRGDVDYRVAHPERHDPRLASCNNGGGIDYLAHDADGSNGIMVNEKKRLAGGNNSVVGTAAAAPSVPMSGYKRQRRAGCYDREELSPATIGYLDNGVIQQAEV